MDAELNSELIIFLSKVRNKTRNDKLNICASVYKKLTQDPSVSVELLKFFYEHADRIASSEQEVAEVIISEETSKVLHEQYAGVVDALFEQILSKNLPVDQFYSKIWEMISGSPSFEDDNAKAFALYYIWIDVRIPYFQLENGLIMSDAEFRELSESLLSSIQKARFIMRTTMYKQRTSRASALLNLLDNFSNEREKAVLMAHIISFTTPNGNHQTALRELLSKLIEDSD